MVQTVKKPTAFNMWLLTTMFAFIQFFLQIIYSAMSDQIMLEFNIDATQTGLLSSSFFYIFIALQIPAGILLDKFHIKWVITIATAICGLGCIVFGLAPNIHVAVIGRVLMGMGGTFGFLGMIKVVRLWYKKNQFSLMVGISELLANLAAALGIGIATYFVVRFGWRGNMVVFGCLVWFLSILSFYFLEQPERSKKLRSYNLSIIKQIIFVTRKPQCWLVCLYAITTGSIMNAFCALWGLPFLTGLYGITHEMAGVGIAIVFIGMAVGCPIIGAIVNEFGKVRLIMMVSTAICSIIMLFIIFPIFHYTKEWIYLLMFLLGLFGSCYFLAYEKMKHIYHESVQGIAMAVCNMSLMAGALIFQPLIGFILQSSVPQGVKHPDSQYTGHEYQMAMITMIILLIISFIISYFIKTKDEMPKPKKFKFPIKIKKIIKIK